MQISGNLSKMLSKNEKPVQYTLPAGNERVEMNDLINKEIELKWEGIINCKHCGSKTKKSYMQGFCYSCFKTAPQAADCILRPELCEAHLGIARDIEWSKENCLKPHFVYLSLTSNVKVGVTRAGQIPTRWIDQGASAAIKLAETPNRHTAGVIETELKKYFSDKTSWQKMLKGTGDFSAEEIPNAKKEAYEKMPLPLKQYYTGDDRLYRFEYPLESFPEKIKSINLEKVGKHKGTLAGIRGQYLIFTNGEVINIRKYTGYKVSISF